MGWNNKRGSYTVFITMVFSAILILLTAAIMASGKKAIDSTAEDFVRLWGKSILAEYDINLKDRYGLFAYYGSLSIVEDKLKYYADYTYKDKKYIEASIEKSSLEAFRLIDDKNLKKQIKEAVVTGSKPKAVEEPGALAGNEDGSGQAGSPIAGNRYITSGWIKAGLPSKGEGGGIGITSIIDGIAGGASLDGMVSGAAENLYIFVYFKDYINDRDLGKTYFQNEIEYILSGKPDDEKARKSVYRKLLLIRNGLNLAYLYSSEEKRDAAMAAAEVITPGPPALVTQALIMETWALLEAVNDLKILYDEKTVPLVKKDENWAITLENVLSDMYPEDGASDEDEEKEKKGGKYIKPQSIEGIEYDGYLKILTAALPEKIKLLRIMDLIQINMKFLYYDSFLISEYYTGLKYTLVVNGKEHSFEEEY